MSTKVHSVSVVVPIYNEVENIRLLHEAISAVMPSLDREYEILLVDDGSTDGSLELLREVAAEDPNVIAVELRSNFGQSAAMMAGIQTATGDVIITMDGDLQNDPIDIPMMVEKIEEGYDLVHGWRKNRQDKLISRKLPSKIANWLISKMTGYRVNDLGCTLKAMRRTIGQELELYGEMHRFIPILAHYRGARCAEVVTHHHARRFGESKYGISRTIPVLLDLTTVNYIVRYVASPMRLFGKIGMACGSVGILTGIATVLMKLISGVDMTGNPLLLLSALSLMIAGQFVAAGMLGELVSRIYFEARGHRPWEIRHVHRSEDGHEATVEIKQAA